MEAIITNFRGGRHTKYNTQMVVEVANTPDRVAAQKLVKKHVTWKSPAGKEIKGEIVSPHGNSGRVRVIFEKGMPGQAIGAKVEVK